MRWMDLPTYLAERPVVDRSSIEDRYLHFNGF